jgi:hypothetical protein
MRGHASASQLKRKQLAGEAPWIRRRPYVRVALSDGLVEAPAEGAANVYPGANPPLHKQETLCFSSRSLQYQSPTPAGLVQ